MRRTTAKHGYRAGLGLWRCENLSCPGLRDIDEPGNAIAHSPRRPGESAQEQFDRRRKRELDRFRRGAPVIAAVFALVALGAFFWLTMFLPMQIAAAAGIAISAGGLYLIMRSAPDVVSWREGAAGERLVGAELEALADFVILHDRRLVGRGGNIDHIAIGPTGVFVIEVKRWRGNIEVVNARLEVRGRDERQIIERLLELSQRVQVALAPEMNKHGMTVIPVLCFVGKKLKGDRVGGVAVIGEGAIKGLLTDRQGVLTPDEVAQVARAVDHAIPPNEDRLW
jgi:Holliday junction resolvase-like predicted endonuclease